MGPIENYDQWHFPINQGVDVLMARSDVQGIMIVDREDAFLTVFIGNGSTSTAENAPLPHQGSIGSRGKCYRFSGYSRSRGRISGIGATR